MRLLGKVNVNSEGQADFGVVVSGTEDLWHLYNFITPGDIIGTKTVRKVVKETATGGGSAEKRTLTLHVQIQKLDFDAGGIMRLSGINRTDTEWVKMNAHHTLEIYSDPPQTVYIHKPEWNSFLADRLKEACDEDSRADTGAVIMDYGQAQVCLVNGSMVITKAKIDVSIPKKRKMNASSRDDSIQKFFGQIFDAMLANIQLEKVKVILICSPGTLREEYMNFVNKKLSAPDLPPAVKDLQNQRSKLLPVLTTSGQRGAINEAIADRQVQQRMSQAKCALDIKIWQEFETLLSTDPDRVCYGPQYCYEAQHLQAIQTLLVSDACFRSHDINERRFYIAFAEEVRNFGGQVHVFSTQHTTGEQLSKISGVAAILRMPCPQLEDIEQDPKFMESEQVMGMIRAQTASDSGMGSASNSTL